MLTFEKACESLKSLGIECNRESEWRGRVGSKDRAEHDLNLFRNVRLPLTPEMWCDLMMADGSNYVGGCCSTMSNLQDAIESIFRLESGWISCQKLEEISSIIVDHGDFDGKVGWSKLNDDQIMTLVNEWIAAEAIGVDEFDPWDRIAMCWHLTRDNYGPEIPRTYGSKASDVDKAVSLLREGLTTLSWDRLIAADPTPEPQAIGNHLLTLSRILPAIKTLYEHIGELSPGDFEGVALFDRQSDAKGINAIASNRRGLCIFKNREDAEELMNLWRKQDAEYKEHERSIDERIEIRQVRVSMSKGLELIPGLVCVLCGRPWEPSYKNRCECGGFCTWGDEKGGKPSSWNEDGSPKPPPNLKE